jgi:3-mercaptopyruvate sulfurtransferase SseA
MYGSLNLVMRYLHRAIVVLLALVLLACQGELRQPGEMPKTASDYPNAHLLVEVDWLEDRLDEPDMRIVDVRSPDDYQPWGPHPWRSQPGVARGAHGW